MCLPLATQRLDRAVGKFEQKTEDDPGDNDGGDGGDDGYDSCDDADDGVDDGGP